MSKDVQNELYSDEVVSLKRNILMEMIGALFSSGKNTNAEIWKLHIDAALDQLDESIYKPLIEAFLKEARKDELMRLAMIGGVNIEVNDYVEKRLKELGD